MIEKQYTFNAITGLARPTVLLIRVADKFLSNIYLECQGKVIELNLSSQSLMDVMSIETKHSIKFKIRAEGIDEIPALQTIENLMKKRNYIEC